jgi:hypothetical protein
MFQVHQANRDDEPVTVADVPRPPTNLDLRILADAETRADSMAVRWYSGVDAAGVVRIFRFQRGRSIEAWRQLLKAQSLQSVAGPLRTRLDAQVALPAASHSQADSGLSVSPIDASTKAIDPSDPL